MKKNYWYLELATWVESFPDGSRRNWYFHDEYQSPTSGAYYEPIYIWHLKDANGNYIDLGRGPIGKDIEVIIYDCNSITIKVNEEGRVLKIAV